MNIEQLAYIVEVDRSGSLTKAAENCHITVTGISRAISMLEKEIGIRIFSRSRSGAIPTSEGTMIIKKARMILDQIHELKSEAKSYAEINEAKLRIATIPGPISLLIDVLTGLRKEYPTIHLEMAEQCTNECIELIRQDKSDIGFVLFSEEMMLKHTGLVFERLVKGNIVLGVSVQSPLASAAQVTIEDLIGLQFVLYNDPYIIEIVQQMGDSVDVLFTSNNIEAIMKAVNENMAVTLGTDYSLRDNPLLVRGDIVAIPLDMSPHDIPYLWSVTSPNTPTSKAANIFVRRVINLLQC